MKGRMLQKNEFLDQLTQLVRIPSVTNNLEANQQAIEYIVSLISPQADIQIIENGIAKILIASNKKTMTPQLGYMVHVDVVAASQELFTLRQEKNLIYGRGVSDMKFSIPLGVALLNELIEKQSPLSFSLVVTTDEEIGGFDGAAHLAKELKWRPKYLIVPDGGDNLEFVRASKGVAQFRIESTGISAHASRVWQGQNAIVPLARLIAELEIRYKKNNATKGWLTTVNFGKIAGGISTNQVCDQATLEIDFRYPETDSFERIKFELDEITEEYSDQLSIMTLSTGLPTSTDPELPIVKKFLRVLKDEFGHEISVQANYGASDARHFAEFAIPILMIKPDGGDIHMESEWLDVESTMKFYEALRVFVKELESEENE